MSIFRRTDKDVKEIEVPFKVSYQQNDPGNVYPDEVIDSLRHMVSRIVRSDSFPRKLALIAALRQEGVSYLSKALAHVLSYDLGARVCVVELNWWWPDSLTEEAMNSGGLAAVMSGSIDLENALIYVESDRLALLPAGNMVLSSRSVAARSGQLDEIISALEYQFDYLILDVPAVLATSDAIPLATRGDGSCLVIRQGVTQAESVRQALYDVDHLPLLGVVMNQVHLETPAWVLKLIPQR